MGKILRNKSPRWEKVRKPSYVLRRLMAKKNGRLRWIGGMLLGAVYIYLFYTFLVAPFTLRWRGVYGDVDYPAGFSIRGIDISHHQGKINWEKVRAANIDKEPLAFVFMKATEGMTLVDRRFAYNFHEAKDNGLMRGAYHFFVPGVSAAQQAYHFISCAHLEPGDLPPVLDIENIGKLDPEELRKSALTWLKIVEKRYGVTPILYTNYKFKRNYLNTIDFDRYPYWIAHYYVKELHYQGDWKFWQHTDKGHIPGIRGDVDLNVFNGSMYNLKKLTIPEVVTEGKDK